MTDENFENLEIKIQNNSASNDIKNHKICNLKICNLKITSKCLGIAEEDLFRGRICIKCYNETRAEYYRKTNGIKKKVLNTEQIQELKNVFNTGQITELMKILNLQSKASVPKLNIIASNE